MAIAIEPTEATETQWHAAAHDAEEWFRAFASERKRMRTAERQELDNGILDSALMRAGIIPNELVHLPGTEYEFDDSMFGLHDPERD